MLTVKVLCMQEAPMLYCGEEIGTGVDPKVCSLVCYFNTL